MMMMMMMKMKISTNNEKVIHGPHSALKELIENSLDASATQISILCKDGGKKLLQITDNGIGIREEDLEIVCERHTTSKLEKFEDLEAMETFGFRGEALASMTYVADVTITTARSGGKCAWKASYRDGKMREGTKEMCAGVTGTTIAVENLFYNVKTRRNALKSGAEEYAKILDVVTRYASSRPDVAFSCRKVGETRATVNAPLVVLSNSGGGGSEGEREGDRVDGEENEPSPSSSSPSSPSRKNARLQKMSTRAHRPNLRSNRLQRTLTVATENEQRQAGEENGAIPHGMRHLILKRQLQSEENDVHLVHQRPIGGMFCVKKSHRNRVSIGFTVLLARKTVRIFEHETPL